MEMFLQKKNGTLHVLGKACFRYTENFREEMSKMTRSFVPGIAPWVTDVMIPCSMGSSLLEGTLGITVRGEFGNTK